MNTSRIKLAPTDIISAEIDMRHLFAHFDCLDGPCVFDSGAVAGAVEGLDVGVVAGSGGMTGADFDPAISIVGGDGALASFTDFPGPATGTTTRSDFELPISISGAFTGTGATRYFESLINISGTGAGIVVAFGTLPAFSSLTVSDPGSITALPAKLLELVIIIDGVAGAGGASVCDASATVLVFDPAINIAGWLAETLADWADAPCTRNQITPPAMKIELPTAPTRSNALRAILHPSQREIATHSFVAVSFMGFHFVEWMGRKGEELNAQEDYANVTS